MRANFLTIACIILLGIFTAERIVFATDPSQIAAKNPKINEFMTSNSETLDDADGDSSDWAEIYNPNNTTFDLTGWHIADSKNTWPFPQGFILQPQQYLVVFASGKNKSQGELHTNFKLDAGGERVALINPQGQTVSEFGPIVLLEDVSFGYGPNGTGNAYFAEPTPGKPNLSEMYSGFNLPPDHSRIGGFYNAPFTLTLNPNDNGDIYYTLDSSEPTYASYRYTGSIQIPEGVTVVRARSMENYKIPSDISTFTYFVNTRKFDLPVVSLVFNPKDLFDPEDGIYVRGTDNNFMEDIEKKASFEFFENGSLRLIKNIYSRMSGQSARMLPQKTFALETKNGESFDYPIFPDQPKLKLKSLNLRNNSQDWYKAFMRDPLFSKLAKGLPGLIPQESRPVVAYLNGQYWGLYFLTERADKDFIKAHFPGIDTDKIDRLKGMTEQILDGSDKDWNNLISFASQNDLNLPQNFEYMKNKINLENIKGYFIAQSTCGNQDFPGNNVEWFRSNDPEGKWHFILFDSDLCGLNAGYGIDYFMAFPVFRDLLKNQSFRADFLNSWANYLNTAFQPEHTKAVIDQIKNSIQYEMTYHIPRWKDEQNSEYVPISGFPKKLNSVEEWLTHVEDLKLFMEKRPDKVRKLIVDYFALSGTSRLTVKQNPPNAGTIAITSILLPQNTENAGVYFNDIPIPVKAIPKNGFVFIGWTGISPSSETETKITLKSDMVITANFAYSASFLRGDTNSDGAVDMSDAIAILNYLFKGERLSQCSDAWDINDDGNINLSDPIYLLHWLFSDGPIISQPFPSSAPDPTPDALLCQ